MQTPYFLINEDILNRNVQDFKYALESYWKNSKLAYSVKTNSLPWILKYMNSKSILAEVVSDEEYLLAKLCGFKDEDIVFNGPIKGETQFQSALSNQAYINVDSKNDLNFLAKCDYDQINNIGIRINVNPSVFNEKDIEYKKDGFRFGFSEENGEFEKVLNIIKSMNKNCHIGLHLHCNSITRSVDVYRSIARYTAQLIKKYNLTPSYIDFGGGYFGGVEGKPTPSDYIKTISKELCEVVNKEETMLIVEPGSALIGSVIDLYTSVIDVKDTNLSRIVTTDGSRIHIDPLWAKSNYMHTLIFKENSNRKKHIEKQIICGYTCMDHDRLMCLCEQPELLENDEIIYHRVGAYSMTFGGPFIRYFPDVYVSNADGHTEMVRKRISVEEYYIIHSN